jgi:hypothetical protein
MAKQLEREWWRLYREDLEQRFEQEEIMIRSLQCGVL